jgi:nicotinamide mononucleotide transporter
MPLDSMFDSILASVRSNILETSALCVSLVAVWLTVRSNPLCWLLNIVAALLYAVVFAQASLYASAGLQGVFVGMSIYGWWRWWYWLHPRHNSAKNSSENTVNDTANASNTAPVLPVRQLSPWSRVALAVGTLLAGLTVLLLLAPAFAAAVLPVYHFFSHRFANITADALADGILSAMSIVATLLAARRYGENWLLWIATDLLYVVLLSEKLLWQSAALYGVFCIFAIVGWREWQKQRRHELIA